MEKDFHLVVSCGNKTLLLGFFGWCFVWVCGIGFGGSSGGFLFVVFVVVGFLCF